MMNNAGLKRLCLTGMMLIFAAAFHIAAAEQAPVERFALYVGSSKGGKGRDVLKYAGSDAQKVSQAMKEIGGIKDDNSLILIDPSKKDIEKAFDAFKKQVADKKSAVRRTEFVFYYSGHSDEENLLLGSEQYSYPQLKKSLTEVDADVEVVMLDSCYSGNFVRTKGGSREKPFLFDDSTIVKGHAYLSSSSEFEASQEADSIQSSYFTYALVTGMRGAADTSGDGKVSLNELYHYAFNETLSRTEFSLAGPQHPSYNITLVGSGDLVLTDVSNSESALVLKGSTAGRYFVRNTNGVLVAEVNKIAGTDIALAMPAGDYVISVVTPTTTAQKTLSLQKGEYAFLDGTGFTSVPRSETLSRGGAADNPPAAEPGKPEPPPVILNIGLWPGAGFNLASKSPDAIVAFNIFGSMQRNITGLQFGTFTNIVTGSMAGLQFSGIFNNTYGAARGMQFAGIVNLAGDDSWGMQLGGILNITRGSFIGAQVGGLMNINTGKSGGLQIGGLLNINTADYNGVQIGGLMNYAADVKGLQLGGLVNVAGNVKGVQLGGIVNYAKRIDGVQFGLINIAKEANGAVFGLLNFILDGIMSPSVYVDSNRSLAFQYQGGTRWFYTVLSTGMPWDFSLDYLSFSFGVGTRIPMGKLFSLDFDVSAKSYHQFNNGKGVKITEDREAFIKRSINVLPSFRLTLNFSPFKHLSVFGGAAFDLDFTGCVPEKAASPMKFGNSTVTAHPSFFIGLKF